MTRRDSLSSGQENISIEVLLNEILSTNEFPPYWEDALVTLLSRLERQGHSSEARVAAETCRDRIARSIQAAEPLPAELREEATRKLREIDIALEHLVKQRQLEEVSLGLSTKGRSMLRERIEAGEPIPVEKRTDVLLLFLNLVRQIWGSTRLFKLLFLLAKETEVGRYVPDYYAFEGGRFGPFKKVIYDDIEALKSCGLVNAQMPLRRCDEAGPELDMELLSDSVDAVYELTERGHMYARALAEFVKLHNPALLAQMSKILEKYRPLSLADLLKYVYKEYPEYTDRSEIRDEILAGED